MTLDQLEALCRGATPGPWHYVREENWIFAGDAGGGAGIFEWQGRSKDVGISMREANAFYIAACSPDYILKLIRVARAARMYASSPDELVAALEALTQADGERG